MTDAAYLRRTQPRPPLRVTAHLSSAHTAEQRAEVIVGWLATPGDPEVAAQDRADIAVIVQHYMDLDRAGR